MRIAVMGILLLLFGCATHPGVVQSPALVAPLPGQAKVVVTRNSDALFMGVQARLDVNGERVAELWRDESYAANVRPGKVVLSTDAWSTPGRFTAHFNAEPDHEYVFVISPRGAHYGTLVFFGIVGAAVEAAIDENTGPFSITLKEHRSTR